MATVNETMISKMQTELEHQLELCSRLRESVTALLDKSGSSGSPVGIEPLNKLAQDTANTHWYITLGVTNLCDGIKHLTIVETGKDLP